MYLQENTCTQLQGQGHTKCYPSTLHHLTLTSRSHEMLPTTLYIMWPIYLYSLKLLRPMV